MKDLRAGSQAGPLAMPPPSRTSRKRALAKKGKIKAKRNSIEEMHHQECHALVDNGLRRTI
jgi:hypothetical protein